MNRLYRAGVLLFLVFPWAVFGQDDSGPQGIRLKGIELLPVADAVVAYDDRVQVDSAGNASSDYYSELSAGVTLRNLPARYTLSATASYGYRFYSENRSLNDDFYNLGADVGSEASLLRWNLSTDLAKTLSYNASYDPDTGTGPDPILTDGESRRSITEGSIAYFLSISDKIAIIPGYFAQHYYQEFVAAESAEWQTHSVGAEMNFVYSPKTTFLVDGYYELQVNGDEDGNTASFNVGIVRVITDKTSLRALIGYGYADYELSGSSQGVLSDIRGQWQVTDKVSAYVFGGNDYQPGYAGGPARMTYRAGYGAGWEPLVKWSLGLQVLHSYDDAVDGKSADSLYGGVRHFFSAQCRYDITTRFGLSLSGDYVNDEQPVNQTVIAIRLDYAL